MEGGDDAVILDVYFAGKLIIVGKETGRTYVYEPSTSKGVITVAKADVDSLLQMTYETGCRCGNGQAPRKQSYFSRRL